MCKGETNETTCDRYTKGITDSRLLILMNLLIILQELYKQLEIIK